MKLRNLRWYIAVMLFLAAVLNYIDRQTLALLKPTIQEDLNLTEEDYGFIQNLFLIAYTIAHLLSGRLVDRWGPRLSMAVFITWWSIANAATGFVRSAAQLGVARFFLGLGEAGNWPASTKAVSEWFPPKERAIAIGFYTFGATLGATIAPILVIRLNTHYGWQAAFVVTGMLGFCWILPWIWLYRRPQDHPLITDRERTLLADAEPPPSAAQISATESISEARRWKLAFSIKAVWLLMFARMLTDPMWYFYQAWFPSYLHQDWNVSQEGQVVTWVVFLAADIGTLLGGFGSALLIKRGADAARARLLTMLACAAIMPLSALIPRMPSTAFAIALAMCVVFAHLAWLANISALIVDVIPRHMLATCFGIAAAGSAIGGIVMNKLVASVATSGNYPTWFVIMAFLHPLAWLLLWVGGIARQPRLAPAAA